MEDRRQIVSSYKARGIPITKAVQIAGISRSSFYYHSRSGKPGCKPSSHTTMVDDHQVCNEAVVRVIISLLGLDFVDYGYIKVTHWLQQRGYCINKKKVYRLMQENCLLHPSVKPSVAKNYVKYTQVLPKRPFEVLEMDIKYMYIHGTGQNALLLTILDTFDRKGLVWKCQYSIRKADVKSLIEELIIKHLQPNDLIDKHIVVTIRNDNGSQFIAKLVRECMRDNFIVQEFTRPGTPQQNGHIESFHSIVKRLVSEKYEFEGLRHLKQVLQEFFVFYNQERIHSSTCYLSPDKFHWAWEQGLVTINEGEKKPMKRFKLLDLPVHIVRKYNLCNFEWSGEADTGDAGEQPVRNILTNWNGHRGVYLPLY